MDGLPLEKGEEADPPLSRKKIRGLSEAMKGREKKIMMVVL
jgi:hypothetical protein